MVAYTGKMVKWASSMSNLTICILMIVLLATVVILPIYFPTTADLEKREEEARLLEQEKVQQIEDKKKDGSDAGKSTAPKPEASESTTNKRRSKRIDYKYK